MKDWGLIGVKAFFGVGNLAFGIWGLVNDCVDFSGEHEAQAGSKCVWASLSTATGLGIMFHTAVQITGTIKTSLAVYLGNPGKRDLVIDRAVEESLSAAVGFDVRHIGNWDGSYVGKPVNKRDEDIVYRPVFGAFVNGRDMHFTMVGERDNHTEYHIGRGPGPATPSNLRRNVKRELMNKQYFDKGGLIFKISAGLDEEAPTLVAPGTSELSGDNQANFDWIYDQMMCNLPEALPVPLPGIGGLVGALESLQQGINFQLMNAQSQNTMAAGAIAVLSDTGDSVLDQMKITGGLIASDNCRNVD